jgi:hypothetical protein
MAVANTLAYYNTATKKVYHTGLTVESFTVMGLIFADVVT